MTSLAHVNIRTTDLDRSVAFYRDVIGLSPGPAATRPRSADHVWMSDEHGNPCIHLQRVGFPSAEAEDHVGMHHLALACSDPDAWRRRLGAMGVEYQQSEFAAARIMQINLVDPDGVRVELLFESQ